MKAFIYSLFCLLLVSCKPSNSSTPEKLVDFLEKQPLTAKEYIIEQFKDKDIVILCERHHGDISQYELFLDIIKDPLFISDVGAVYTEVGVERQSPLLNSFLKEEKLDSLDIHKRVTQIYRGANSELHLWWPHSYPWLIREVYHVNQELDSSQKIAMYGCDESIHWEEWSKEEFTAYDELMDEARDSLMAANFIRQFGEQPLRNGKKKALVIMNYRHAFLQHYHNKDYPCLNFGKYIYDVFGDQVASVLLMGQAYPTDEYSIVKNGLWDAAFELAGKTNTGFTLEGTPFGESPCDMSPNLWPIYGFRYQDIFTGIAYYLPIEQHLIKQGWEGAFTEEFRDEFTQRCLLVADWPDDELDNFLQAYIEGVNKVSCSRYNNLKEMRNLIDQWK